MTVLRDAPIFVCGADRSGTSLMYALLASHPRVSMVRRSNMWRWFHGKHGDLDDPGNLESLLSTLEHYPRLAPLAVDWQQLRADLAEGPVSYGRVFSSMHAQRADRLGRSRWGDKSLHSEHHAEAIFGEFPEARVIQLIRDPRDRHASIVNRYAESSRGLASTTGRWLDSVAAARRNERRFTGRYLVVRFEDLAADPHGVMTTTCAFLDEPFVEEMLEMRGAPDHQAGNSSFADVTTQTISTKPIGRYRTKLDPADVALIQLLAGRAMKRQRYALDPVSIDARQRLRLLATDLPMAAARTMAWRLRDRRAQRSATPPEHRLDEAASS